MAAGSFIGLLEGEGQGAPSGEAQGPGLRAEGGGLPGTFFSPCRCFSFPGQDQSLAQPCPEGGGEEGCATGQKWRRVWEKERVLQD